MVRLLIIDVDGVLTDGTLILGDADEVRAFHVHDGLGIRLAAAAGMSVALLSARASNAVTRRAAELGVAEVVQGVPNKLAAYEALRDTFGVTDAEVCYIGDDLIDLPVLRRVGLPCAVADATDDVKNAARFIAQRCGGRGAVREIIEWILKADGRWETACRAVVEPEGR